MSRGLWGEAGQARFLDTSMRAFTLDRFGAQPALRDDIPEPHVGDDELLVRVHASSVNPVDVHTQGKLGLTIA
jgi:NADPH:quinone reductase-like Zn-dependent oxidoreductase